MFCCGGQDSGQVAEVVKTEPAEEAPPAEVVKEEPKGPKFTFEIVGARGIRNSDWMPGSGKPDCYCEVKHADKLLHSTKTIDDCMVPKWQEEFQVEELVDGAELEFKVWDKDVIGSDYLGKVVLAPDTYMEKGFSQEFAMTEAGTGIKAYLGLKMKTRGQENYPPGPPATFEIEVEKGDAKEYGLEIDSQDMKNLQIAAVDLGAFQEYNKKTTEASLQVIRSDYIVAVNGVEGSTDMMKEFAKPKVKVKIVRACDTSVLLEIEDKKKKHGLKFPAKMKNDVLVVMEIGDGYVKEYNEKCDKDSRPSEKILPYDRIVRVEDKVGKASNLKSMLEKKKRQVPNWHPKALPRGSDQKVSGWNVPLLLRDLAACRWLKVSNQCAL